MEWHDLSSVPFAFQRRSDIAKAKILLELRAHKSDFHAYLRVRKSYSDAIIGLP
jgi:hypothetical protein